MKLNNIRLLVNDFDQCFDFYKNKVGLKVTWGEPGSPYASFDIGIPSGLCLFKSELMAESIESSANQVKDLLSQDRFVIVINIENVDQTYKTLSSRGVEFINTPRNMEAWGLRVVHLRDPEGNLLELYSELPREQWGDELKKDAEKYG